MLSGTCHAGDEGRFSLADEAGHDVVWTVPLDYLGQPVVDIDHVACRCGGHVAVGQGVVEPRARRRELA